MKQYLINGLVALVVAVIVVHVFMPQSEVDVVGAVNAITQRQAFSFLQGLYAGTNRQLSVDNAGLLTSSAGLNFTAGDGHVNNLIGGGTLTTISGNATGTVTAANVCDNTMLSFGSNSISASTTLPTLTALKADCFTSNGNVKVIYFRNTGGAASTTQFAAGASTTLVSMTGGDSVMAGGQIARLTFIRATDSTGFVLLED